MRARGSVLSRIEELRYVPVATLHSVEEAQALAERLRARRLPLVEVTLRTDSATECLRALAERGDMLVGAGTVTDPERARDALEVGAQFLVAPGLDEETVRLAQQRDILVLPGVATPTEVQRAARLGLRELKLFPALHLGGIPYLRLLAAVFPGLRFCPTGGVGEVDAESWLAEPNVFAVGGSWLARTD